MKRLLAALSFFTRLPFWRFACLEKKHYENIVPLWPVVGLLTGGVMAAVFTLASLVLPMAVAAVLAVVSRIVLTGGLHEDGFADFCDGFGGNTTGDAQQDRDRTLRIMKDSFIGTYGVLGLILYLLLLWTLLTSLAGLLPPFEMAGAIIGVDVVSKWVSTMIVFFLPYARTAEGAKNKLVYDRGRPPFVAMLLSVLTLNAPVLYGLFRWMKQRIGGYTGDCCGATFVVMEIYNYLLLLLLCTRFL